GRGARITFNANASCRRRWYRMRLGPAGEARPTAESTGERNRHQRNGRKPLPGPHDGHLQFYHSIARFFTDEVRYSVLYAAAAPRNVPHREGTRSWPAPRPGQSNASPTRDSGSLPRRTGSSISSINPRVRARDSMTCARDSASRSRSGRDRKDRERRTSSSPDPLGDRNRSEHARTDVDGTRAERAGPADRQLRRQVYQADRSSQPAETRRGAVAVRRRREDDIRLNG